MDSGGFYASNIGVIGNKFFHSGSMGEKLWHLSGDENYTRQEKKTNQNIHPSAANDTQ